MTTSRFGKRSAKHIPSAGLRDVAPNFGKPLYSSGARKFRGGDPTRVEGSSEQLVARMLDIHPAVETYEPQGLGADLITETLLYTKEQRDQAKRRYAPAGGTSYYTADFSASLASVGKRVYEVKAEQYASDPESEERFRRARPIFIRYGVDVCKVVVPPESHPIWSNVALVHKAAHRSDVRARLLSSVDTLSGRRVFVARDALEVLGASTNDLPALIAMGLLAVDLFDGRIRAGMRAALAHGTLDHLSVLDRLTR